MKRKLYAVLIIALSIIDLVYATEKIDNTNKKGDIIGVVVDASDGKPVEYATIALYKTNDQTLITGSISDNEGFFRIKNSSEGAYYLTVTFMGYETKTIPEILINPDTREYKLEKIMLEPNVKELEGVNVIADQASVQYKIDKKVVNVGQQLTAKSGTAVDILENVPSVKVDIEGNVTLRGSGSFTVLVDGRPTVLEPSDALSQIPAGAIENIEIITNPSAKYEPDGATGIINIVTKKSKLNGVSGIVNANMGRFENYGADFTVDNRQDQIYFYLGGDYNQRNRPGAMEYQRNVFNADGNDYHVNSIGDFLRMSLRSSLKGGLDWSFSEKDVLGLAFRIGQNSMDRSNENDYEEYSDFDSVKKLYFTENNWSRGGEFYEVNMNYRHDFNKDKTHFVDIQAQGSSRGGDEIAENFQKDLNNRIESGQKTTEKGPYSSLRLKMDYTQPFKWGGKLEAGWQSQLSKSDEINEVYHYDTVDFDYVFQDNFSNNVSYTRNTHAAYGTFGGEYGDFGYQAGLRIEYTYRNLELVEKQQKYTIDRPDYFPTLHLSYKMPAEQQTMISYTRRIERPRGHYLEPFITYMDAYNVRQGNPDLSPEYINSFDLSYQKKFMKQNFFSVEGYYRITENKIERIMTKYAEDSTMLLQSYVNAGADYALGLEFMLNYSPSKWYTTNLMADLYDYRLKGTLSDKEYEQHDFSWNARFNNTFKAGMNTRFQLDFMYQSPTIKAQGSMEGFFSASMAYKQDFFNRKMSATLQVRDVFGTWKHASTTVGTDFNQYSQFIPKTPIVMLTLSYKINNYNVKPQRNSNGDTTIDAGEDM